MKLLCILAVVCLAAASPHHHGDHSREKRDLMGDYRYCLRTEMIWTELIDKDCTEFMTGINLGLTKLFSTELENATDFFDDMCDTIRDAIEYEDEEDFPCDAIVCFKREMLKKVVSEGMPTICHNRTKVVDLGGFAEECTGEVLEDIIDAYCYQTEKTICKIHAIIVADQIDMPEFEYGGKPFHIIDRMTEHCSSYELQEGTCTGVLDFTDYVEDMFKPTWNVSLKKEQIMSNFSNPDQSCAAIACFESAFDGKLDEAIEMPEVCDGLWTNRTIIFQESGFTDLKLKLLSCMSSFKLYLNRKLDDSSLICNGNATQFMEDLYSEDDDKINATLTGMVQMWQEMAENPMELIEIPDEVFCNIKAMKTKLTDEGELPSFCDEEDCFDQDITTASLQDIQKILCYHFEKLADFMDLF